MTILVFAHRPGDTTADAGVARLEARFAAEAAAWRPQVSAPGLQVWSTRGGPSLRVLPGGAAVIVGEVFDPAGRRAKLEGLPAGPRRAAEALCGRVWGRYLAVFAAAGGEVGGVLRDPSGGCDALLWSLGDGVEALASDLLALPGWLRPRLSLNWDRIAGFVAAPSGRIDPLFDGVTRVPPGGFAPFGRGGAGAELVWRPLAGGELPDDDPPALAAALVQRVDLAARTLTAGHDGLMVEVSGGLDSAIVAGSLAAVGRAARVRGWLNAAPDRAEADERRYAQAVTDALGVPLTVAPLAPGPVSEADFAALAGGLTPAIAGFEPSRDRDLARRLRALDCSALVTGQGGDAVFYQMPSPLLALEALDRMGPAALGAPLVRDLARRRRISVWELLAEARRLRRSGGRLPPMPGSLAPAAVTEEMGDGHHPWLDWPGLTPARRLQVRAIANILADRGPSRVAAVAEVLHPLLAQPVLELVLRIPTRLLAGGLHDRAFARAAFAARLPAAVRERRSKGTYAAVYARWIAGQLAFFRPYLLDGCLAAAGVLDRARLDALLSPERLLQSADAPDVLTATAVEAWVRRWQGRVPDSRRRPGA